MRQTCPVKSLTLVVLGWDWVPFLPWNPAKMLLRWEMFIFITFITTFRYHDQIHLNKRQPESCPCIQESISKNNHENRAKNGKFFTVEFAQKASQPIKFSAKGFRGAAKRIFFFCKPTQKDAPAPKLHFQLDCSKMVNKMVNFSL
jgi:hypothetical protein